MLVPGQVAVVAAVARMTPGCQVVTSIAMVARIKCHGCQDVAMVARDGE